MSPHRRTRPGPAPRPRDGGAAPAPENQAAPAALAADTARRPTGDAMPFLTRFLAALLLVGLLVARPLPAAADTEQVFAHLFVVPAALADGASALAAAAALETWLAETYGGYTRLGAGVGGWKNEVGQIETEANAIYLTTAPRDVSKDIAARLAGDFGVRVPYVLVLPAGAFTPSRGR